jgi:hypothetical protein
MQKHHDQMQEHHIATPAHHRDATSMHHRDATPTHHWKHYEMRHDETGAQPTC